MSVKGSLDGLVKFFDLVSKGIDIAGKFTKEQILPAAEKIAKTSIPLAVTVPTVVIGTLGANQIQHSQALFGQSTLTQTQPTQASSARNEANIKQWEILSNYFDKTQKLLTRENIGGFESGTDESIKNLLKANSFAALRNLDKDNKGYLIRFLAENGLIKANNSAISLSGANLQTIDLHDAWLPDINLEGVYMLKGNLSHTNLKRSTLHGAKLRDVDLTGADLTGADLTSTDLTGADLTSTDLTGANLLD